MSAGAISSLGNITDTSGNGFGAISSDEFVKVMITELTNQDPFEPQDSGALLEQMSSLRNIESQMSLQDSIGELVKQNQFTLAGGLIGEEVAGLSPNGQYVTGQVESVRISDGEGLIVLDNGEVINVDSVSRIGQLSDFEQQNSGEDLLRAFAAKYKTDDNDTYYEQMTLADYNEWRTVWSKNANQPMTVEQVEDALADPVNQITDDEDMLEAGDYNGDGITDGNDTELKDEVDRLNEIKRMLTKPDFADGDFNDDNVIDNKDLNTLDQVIAEERLYRLQNLADAEALGYQSHIDRMQAELDRFMGTQ